MPTHSTGAPDSNAERNAHRPTRPKPLIATRTDMTAPFGGFLLSVTPPQAGGIGARPAPASAFYPPAGTYAGLVRASVAWAAASRATGTRNGEHET